MLKHFKIGDLVEWNSDVGLVRGRIKKKITSEIAFKGYKVHASNHLAMHKGSTLKKIKE